MYKSIFGFLLGSKDLKLLNDIKLRKCSAKFVEPLYDNYAELDDLFSKLQLRQMTSPESDVQLRAMEIFEFVRDIDKVFILRRANDGLFVALRRAIFCRTIIFPHYCDVVLWTVTNK